MKELDNKPAAKTSTKILSFIALCLCLFLMAPAKAADNSGIGFHAAPFLKISPAARQVSMGGAFTALSGDINLMRYNVGGLGGINYPSLAVNFNTWIDDTQQGNLVFGLPLGKAKDNKPKGRFGTLGVDLTYFNEGVIEELDADFLPTGVETSSGDLLASFGWGKNLGSQSKPWKFGIGVAGKYLSQELVGITSTVWAIDAGAQLIFQTQSNDKPLNLSLGAAIQNYGLSKVKFDSWESPLPETYRFGAALDFDKFPLNTWQLILASDGLWTTKEGIKYHFGTELVVNKVFSVRGGYKFNDPSMSKWGVGFGLYMPTDWLGNSAMRFDYAYAPLQAFEEAAHRFSLHFAFGAGKGPITEAVDSETAAVLMDMAAKQDSLDAVLKAAKDAEARLRALEQEMRERLARIQKIADESAGKIEVAQQPDDARKILVTMRINFDFDKATIRPDEFGTMNKVGEILNTYPNSQVHLSGHTDWIGSDDYNIHLSQRRIDSVMVYLSQKGRVAQNRFYMPVGYGESRPIATNETEDGRFRNRRVEFMLFTYDAKPEMPQGTAIVSVEAVDANTIHIVGNGIIPAPVNIMSLDNPYRFVMDFPNIYLVAKEKEFSLNVGPYIKARAGAHIEEKFTRVVLDVTRPISPVISVFENKIIIKTR